MAHKYIKYKAKQFGGNNTFPEIKSNIIGFIEETNTLLTTIIGKFSCCLEDMKTLSSLLFSVAKVWDVSETDPVLSCSYSLLSSLLLDRIGQHRSAISLLKKVKNHSFR